MRALSTAEKRTILSGGLFLVLFFAFAILNSYFHVDKSRFSSDRILGFLMQQLSYYADEVGEGFFPDQLQWKKRFSTFFENDGVVYIPGRKNAESGEYHRAIIAWRKEKKYIFYVLALPYYSSVTRFNFIQGDLPIYAMRDDDITPRQKVKMITEGTKPEQAQEIMQYDGETLLLVQLMCKDNEGALLSIGKKEQINTPDPNGITPLMRAVSNRNDAIVAALLANGADTAARNIFGDTALDIAEKTKHKKIIAWLRDHPNNAAKPD